MYRRIPWLLAATTCLLSRFCLATPHFGAEQPSGDARFAATQVLDTSDHAGQPFAIVDKREARIYVFAGNGRLMGASPVLLGLAVGDFAVPGISGRAPASLSAAERTTPAGRFASEPGHNDKGDDIVWVDYGASLAIHRLRPAPAIERRPDRLASPVAEDRRISFGCIVVPVAFYDAVVGPSLGRQRGVVYVLPESRPVQAMFDIVQVSLLGR